MHPIKLISSDFDGTLIGFGSDGRCSATFATALEAHRDRGGLWAVNTGRSLEHAIDGMRRFNAPVAPDFLLTNEREVFRRGDDADWVPYGEWNAECHRRHEELFSRAAGLFSQLESLAKRRGGITMIYEEHRPIGLVTQREQVMEELIRELDEALLSYADFSYQRNTVYLRFCHRDYHKGSALAELCRLENIPASEVFAAGDHFNDLPMLDGKYATMTACPANAIDQVKERVRLSAGCISSLPWADGVAAALRHYEGQCAN